MRQAACTTGHVCSSAVPAGPDFAHGESLSGFLSVRYVSGMHAGYTMLAQILSCSQEQPHPTYLLTSPHPPPLPPTPHCHYYPCHHRLLKRQSCVSVFCLLLMLFAETSVALRKEVKDKIGIVHTAPTWQLGMPASWAAQSQSTTGTWMLLYKNTRKKEWLKLPRRWVSWIFPKPE